MEPSAATLKVLEQLDEVCKVWYALPKESLPLTDEEWSKLCSVIHDGIMRLERNTQALKAKLKNTKAVIQTRQEEIAQQRRQIDKLCAAEISKKEMHKVICDQAQVISDLLSVRKTTAPAPIDWVRYMAGK